DDVATHLRAAARRINRRARTEPWLQVHTPADAPWGDRAACARIERDEVFAPDDKQAPLTAGGPVGNGTRAVAAQPMLWLVVKRLLNPDGLSGAGMKRLDQPDAIRTVEDAVDHQRRRAKVMREREGVRVGDQARIDGRAPPGDAKLRDVVLVDLVEGRILRASGIAAVPRPFATAGALLSGWGHGNGDHRETCPQRIAHPHPEPPSSRVVRY